MLVSDLKKTIRTVPDFPKPGISYKDISTLFRDPVAFGSAMGRMVERYKGEKLDAVAGIDARGFIVASVLAYELNLGTYDLTHAIEITNRRRREFLPTANTGGILLPPLEHFILRFHTLTFDEGCRKASKFSITDTVSRADSDFVGHVSTRIGNRSVAAVVCDLMSRALERSSHEILAEALRLALAVRIDGAGKDQYQK